MPCRNELRNSVSVEEIPDATRSAEGPARAVYLGRGPRLAGHDAPQPLAPPILAEGTPYLDLVALIQPGLAPGRCLHLLGQLLSAANRDKRALTADGTISSDVIYLEQVRARFGRPLWDMEPPDADEYFGKALRTTAKEAQLLNAHIST